MPHAVAVDDVPARGLGDPQHPTVDVLGDTREHAARRFPQTGRPVLPHQFKISPDAATGDHNRPGGKREVRNHVTRRCTAPFDNTVGQDRPDDTRHHTRRHRQLVDSVTKRQPDLSTIDGRPYSTLERRDQRRPRTPHDMKTRHRVAVTVGQVTTAFRPSDDGKEPYPPFSEPGTLLPRGEVHVRLGPPTRPNVLLPVKPRRPPPILHGQLERIAHAHAPLLRGVNEEQPPKRPERLSAKRLFGFLVQQNDPFPGVDKFGGGYEPGQAGSDHDHIGVHCPVLSSLVMSWQVYHTSTPLHGSTYIEPCRFPPPRRVVRWLTLSHAGCRFGHLHWPKHAMNP